MAETTKRAGLKHRHLHFIALGSAIGTGLFYGSAGAIQAAGPSVLLVYLLGGAVVYFLLRALGEMSVHHPVTGSFAEYARTFLGPWAGYITGWMFAFEMVIVALADLTAIGVYMQFWFPGSPKWVWVAATLLLVGGANLATVKAFGELEFAFTIVKVGAVIAMILGGVAVLVFGLSTAETTGPANLVNDGGFFPNGVSGMVASFILVLFAFGGTEIVGVASAEAEDPAKSVPKAVNTIPVRILLFYVLAILVILMINPWRSITGEESPFVQIFSTLGVTWAAAALNVVVITAAVSAINADLFGAGNVLTGLARQNLAPKVMAKKTRGVPVMTMIILLIVMIIGTGLNALIPENVFEIIASLATFATIYVWLMILLAHVASRRQMSPGERASLEYTVPFWPWGQYFSIAFIIFTFGIMVWQEQYRPALATGVIFILLMTGIFYLTGRRSAAASSPQEVALQTRRTRNNHERITMNTVDAPAYSPAPEWSGRSDGPGPEHARWHSVVRPLDVAKPQAEPGVALLGFASDEGVERNHGRPGAAAGPAALRGALGSLALHHPHPLYDAGTITTQGTDLEAAHERLSDAVESLSRTGHLPIVLGGGHETAFGSHRGVFRAQGPLQIINLDAHFDLRTADVPTSGTPFKQISELVGREDFDYSVLGISRPNNTPVLFDEAADLGVTVVLDEDVLTMDRSQLGATIDSICSGTKPIHLSIDLDVLPADQAPGVSAPAGLGVPVNIIRALALSIAATGRLALVDVVELNPTFDTDSHTAKLAARLIDDIVTAHFSATAGANS